MSGAVGSTPELHPQRAAERELLRQGAPAAGSRPRGRRAWRRRRSRGAEGLGEVRRAGHAEAPRPVGGHARCRCAGRSRPRPARRARCSVTRPPGRRASAPSRCRSIARASHEPAGAGAQEPVGDAPRRRARMRGEAVERREGPDQHRGAAALGLADQVGAPVQAVGAVDVEVARRPEHDERPAARAAEAVGGGVVLLVALGLDDHPADAVHGEDAPDEVRRHLGHRAREEVALEPRARRGAGPPVTMRPPGRAPAPSARRRPRGRCRPAPAWPPRTPRR